MLSEEEVAVIEGRGVNCDYEVVGARIRVWDINEGETAEEVVLEIM